MQPRPSTAGSAARFASGQYERSRNGGAVFTGDARFSGVTFERGAVFEGTRLLGIVATATRESEADRRRLLSEMSGSAEFRGAATFYEARFGGAAAFRSTAFAKGARFDGAQFAGAALFHHASFAEGVRFTRANFDASASFAYAIFNGADFTGATFRQTADFRDAVLHDVAALGPCVADKLDVSGITASGGLLVQCAAEQIRAENVPCLDGMNLQLDGGIYLDAPDIRSSALTLSYVDGCLTPGRRRVRQPGDDRRTFPPRSSRHTQTAGASAGRRHQPEPGRPGPQRLPPRRLLPPRPPPHRRPPAARSFTEATALDATRGAGGGAPLARAVRPPPRRLVPQPLPPRPGAGAGTHT